MDIQSICQNLRNAANLLATHTAVQKNRALACVRDAILADKNAILAANKVDVDKARAGGMSEALIERLSLDDKKINSILQSIDVVIAQTDPIGQIAAGWTIPNGMRIRQERVPLGVVGIIYESRPNVTVDAFTLAYKSGNAILLRGSSSALQSNLALETAIKAGLRNARTDGVQGALELVKSIDHSDVDKILTATGLIDVVLPRGGAKLINTVVEKAKVPVIQTGAGVCHLYVDDSADIGMAAKIAENAKIQRPGACNAIECVLVHRNIAEEFLPELIKILDNRVLLKADELCLKLLDSVPQQYKEKIIPATDADFGFEFLDFTLALHAVDSVEEAIDFINTHNTQHSETIITNNRHNARQFQTRVDAACVYVNASTRFTDGGEFGFGAELGVSTQKLHARGPMGIQALTTIKYLIDGEGQVR